MKIETSKATPLQLNYLVAKCEGGLDFAGGNQPLQSYLRNYHPAINWSQGGPIIERERICIDPTIDPSEDNSDSWGALAIESYYYGPTPLVAAMRCYVASKLGNEVEIPEGLK